MPDSNPPSGDGVLKRFEAGEYVVDLLSGILLLALFGPFLYALSFLFTGSDPWRFGDPVVGIFPGALTWVARQRLDTFTPWLLLGIAAVIGTVSRSVLILYNLMFWARWMEKIISVLSLCQIRCWHQLSPEWNDRKVIAARLINRSPFHLLGGKDYAAYRAWLLSTGERGCEKQYWYYEMPLYLRASHFYALFYTFFWCYLIYGGLTYLYIHHWARSCFYWNCFGSWLLILAVIFVLLIGLFEEVILHGSAFVAIDDALSEDFRTSGAIIAKE